MASISLITNWILQSNWKKIDICSKGFYTI